MISNWTVSPDIQVMLRPATTFPQLMTHEKGGLWLALRRPLFTMFLLGCAVSITATGRLTLRLVVSGAVSSCWLPLFTIFSLLVVFRLKRPGISVSRLIDLSCTGLVPWFLFLLAFALVFGSVPPLHSYEMLQRWTIALVPVIAWCCYIDFFLFRAIFDLTPARTVRLLILQRLICWSLGIAYFFGHALWALIVTGLGL